MGDIETTIAEVLRLDAKMVGQCVRGITCDPRDVNALAFMAPELAAEVRRLRAELAEARANRQHCPTCICGKRAPVQGDDGRKGRGPGSITWAEHLLAWSGYAARYGTGQSAERMAERGGFGFGELQMFLGHEPTTWEPRPATGDER